MIRILVMHKFLPHVRIYHNDIIEWPICVKLMKLWKMGPWLVRRWRLGVKCDSPVVTLSSFNENYIGIMRTSQTYFLRRQKYKMKEFSQNDVIFTFMKSCKFFYIEGSQFIFYRSFWRLWISFKWTLIAE